MYCIWKCLQCLVSVWDHRLLSIWLEFSAKASVFRLIKNNNRFFSSEDVTILATIVDWGKTNSSLMCGWGCWPLLRDVPNGRTPFTDWASGIVSQYPVWLEAQPQAPHWNINSHSQSRPPTHPDRASQSSWKQQPECSSSKSEWF